MADNSLTPNLLESFDRLSLNQLSKSSPSRLPPFQLKRSRSQQGPVPPLPGNPNDHPPSSKQNNNGNNSKRMYKRMCCVKGCQVFKKLVMFHSIESIACALQVLQTRDLYSRRQLHIFTQP